MDLPVWWPFDKPYAMMDCRPGMQRIPNDVVDIIITSPCYNVGKEYEEQLSEDEYYAFILSVMKEIKRVLKPDGRICWNVPYQMYTKSMDHETSQWYISVKALIESGMHIRDNITWNQNNSDNDTAWGSFKSASSPWLRHQTEAIIIGYNEVWKKLEKGIDTITKDEFMKYVVDLWSFPPERDRTHPAPFPFELPYRCCQLFSYKGDIVLDPFLGSGTTLLACRKTGRRGLGFEKDMKYESVIHNKTLCDIPSLEKFDQDRKLEDFD